MNHHNYIDNKRFWNTMKPLFSNFGGGSQKITLVKDDKIISNDKEVAETFNKFFANSVHSLNISENKALLNATEDLTDPVKIALKKFEFHPSILEIKDKVTVETKFYFSKIGIGDIEVELRNLKTKKASTFMNIPAKHIKQVVDIIAEPLMQIWNREIVDNKKFPTKLKYADLTPIFKSLECIIVKNYRPVSILPVKYYQYNTTSKIFNYLIYCHCC